jgi:hypothetical protein
MKLLVAAVFLLVLLALCMSAARGRALHKVHGSAYIAAKKTHKVWARISFIGAWASVGLTEALVRLNGGFKSEAVAWVHLPLAFSFFILLNVIWWWCHGERAASLHRILAYSSIGIYFPALITGLILLVRI